MSGGHYDHAYQRVLNMADTLRNDLDEARSALSERDHREAIHAWLGKAAEALRTLEWYDSDDIGDWNRVVSALAEAGLKLEPIPEVPDDGDYLDRKHSR